MTTSTHQVRVGDVGPGGDAVDAVAVLPHHRVADVRKLAVLEYQEVCMDKDTWTSARVWQLSTGAFQPLDETASRTVLAGERLQLLHKVLAEVSVQVHVRLQHADVRAHLAAQQILSISTALACLQWSGQAWHI